ncbi:MAG: hypothetical protein R2776_04125 [Flavobacteriaceae bacterium]|nr:hypothetical protein [Flavobacteriaceae bacterium]
MKQVYLLLALLSFSCNQFNKNQNTEPLSGTGTMEMEAEKAADATLNYIDDSISFKEQFEKLPLKKAPLIDTTNFNSFKDKDNYELINAEALKLPQIYKNWYVKGYEHRTISGYRLQLSDFFYTAVITSIIGNNEMQTILINYTEEGVLIDWEMVSYNERTDELTKYATEININKIIRSYYIYITEDDLPIMEVNKLKINPNGTIEDMGTDDIFYDLVSESYGIPISRQIPKLNVFKVSPYNSNEAVVIIPEIAEGNPEELFELNTHMAVIDIRGEAITHYYFESHTTNGWISDAVVLDEILVDFPAFSVNEETKPIEVKVKYYGSSRVNPYYNNAISLFIKGENSLKKILHQYSVEELSGELDGPCIGTTLSEKKTLMMEKGKTNGYFIIAVKNILSETIDFEDKNGECQSKETIKTSSTFLRYNGVQYVEQK